MSTSLKEISQCCLTRLLNRLDSISHIKNKETTYCEHFIRASSMGIQMIRAGIWLFIHTAFPNYLERTGSDILKKLHKEL